VAAKPKLTKLELDLMEVFWQGGSLSVRQVQEWFPAKSRPTYTTLQTNIYRLESKGAVRRVGKIGNAHIFEAVVSRGEAQRRFVDDLVTMFGGRPALVMTHLVESGQLTLDDVKEAEQLIKSLARKDQDR
jgi:predicted transcriptional regulator